MGASMKLVLDQMSDRTLFIAIMAFVALYPLAYGLGALGPSVTQRHELSAWDCTADTDVFDKTICNGVDITPPDGGTWSGQLREVDRMNQCFRLQATIHNRKYVDSGVFNHLDVRLSMEGKQRSDTKWTPMLQNDRHTRDINCELGDVDCHTLTLLRETFVPYEDFRVNVTLGAPSREAGSFVGDVIFTFTYVNETFTLVELSFKYAFIVVTLNLLVIFLRSMRHFRLRDWMHEQVWLGWLMVGLLAFNDPFFLVGILSEGWFFPFISTIMQVTFLALLLLFWLLMLDGMLQDEYKRAFSKFYLPKLLLVGLMWGVTVALLTYAKSQMVSDPAFGSDGDTIGTFVSDLYAPHPTCKLTSMPPDMMGTQIFLACLFGVYAFWFCFLLFRGFGGGANTSVSPRRFRVFALLTLTTLVYVSYGLTVANVQRNHTMYHNASGFIAYYTLFNGYVLLTGFLYRPAKGASHSTVYEQLTNYRIQ